VETGVRASRPSSNTAWVPGGMYSPWITTMSSGHGVSEYELGASGLPRAYVSPQQPGRVISMFAGCLANHDRAHSRCMLIPTRYMRCHSGFPKKKRHKYSGLRQIFWSDNSGNLLSRETGKDHFFSFFFKYGVFEEPFLHFQLSGVMKVSVRW
jgi:hypothetical protein